MGLWSIYLIDRYLSASNRVIHVRGYYQLLLLSSLVLILLLLESSSSSTSLPFNECLLCGKHWVKPPTNIIPLITTATGRHRNFTYPILLMKKLNLREELLALGPHSWQSVVPRLKPRCEGLQSLCSLMLSMFRTSPPPILLLSLALFLPTLGRNAGSKCAISVPGWSILESSEKEQSFPGCASPFSSWLVPVRLHSQKLLSGAGGLQQLFLSSEWSAHALSTLAGWCWSWGFVNFHGKTPDCQRNTSLLQGSGKTH